MAQNEKICRFCQPRGNYSSYVAHEMMLGMREAFDYFQYTECHCLQISSLPTDLARLYPPRTAPEACKSAARKMLERLRVNNALFGRGYKLAKLASQLVDFPPQLRNVGPLFKEV